MAGLPFAWANLTERHLLKREYRLTERDRFQQIRRTGNCWSDRQLVVCLLPNDLQRNRFGFSVSKRVGKAVVRNRVRRRMRESVRLRLDTLSTGYDVVFVARPPSARSEFMQIDRSVARLLHLAGLLSETGA